MRNDKKNQIVEMTEDFAVSVFNFCEELNHKRYYLLANQLFKSGTSIGANVFEAQNAESMKDFIHKFKIAAKEIDETEYWLRLCNRVNLIPAGNTIQSELKQMNRMVSKIISTSKRKQNHIESNQ